MKKLLIATFFMLFLSSCVHTVYVDDKSGKEVAKIEKTIDILNDLIERHEVMNEAVIKNTESIENSVDRLIYLFQSYQSESSRIIDELRELVGELQ